MYIDYSKLWKLLIDKNMSKTDLLQLTGISSRVLAKLSKNETVTTDTIARICTALDCDVSDIMECVSEKRLSVYSCYKRFGKCTEENDLYKVIRFAVGDQMYAVCVSKQSANKETHIHCEKDGVVYWEQIYPIGYITSNRVKSVLIKPQRNENETVIVLIKGKPGVIIGLDENGFASSKRGLKESSDIYVMSEAAFKVFDPQK